MPPSPESKKPPQVEPDPHEVSHEEPANPAPEKAPGKTIGAAAIGVAVWAWLKGVGHFLWRRLTGLPHYVLWIIGILLALLVALILFLANPNWNWFKPTLTGILEGRLHRPVQIDGDLRVHLFRWTPDATVNGLKIGHPDWVPKDRKDSRPQMGTADKVAVTAELMPLFIGRIVLPRLEVHRPTLDLWQDAEGRANWDFSNGKSSGKPTELPPIKNFLITDGRLSMVSLSRNLRFTGTISAHEEAQGGRQAFELTGDGALNGQAFEMDATGGPLLNVRRSKPYPFDMTVRAGQTRLTAKGRVLQPFKLSRLDGRVTVQGPDLATLYDLTGLTFPNTPAYRIDAHVTRDGQVYDIRDIKGRVGGSDVGGTLKVERRPDKRLFLSGDLHSRLLDFQDLGSLFGATAANAPQAPRIEADPGDARTARRLLPDVSLDVNRVRRMDAKVTYRAAAVKARPNLPLREVSLGIDLNKGLLILDPVQFRFPQGRLTGTARIDARGEVQHNAVDFALSGLRVQDMVPEIQGAEPLEGTLHARLKLQGDGRSVHDAAAASNGEFTAVMPGGRIRQSLAELMGINATKGLFLYLSKDKKETDVRCAVAHFDVKGGVMQAQTIVLDTGVVLVNGEGSINLKDERLRLQLKGKPKEFRLVRVNAPLVIGGNLSAPSFGVETGPALVQGGLAVVLNSAASILPFFGLGTAENANCQGLVSQAKAEGAPVK